MFCLTMAASCIRIKHPLMQNDSSDQETSSNLPKLHNLSKLVTKILQRLRWTYTPIRQCSRRKGECGIKQSFPRGTLQPRENLSQQTLSRLAPPPHLARTGSDAHQTRHWGKPWLAAMVHILGLGTLPRKKNVCLNIYSSRRLWMKRQDSYKALGQITQRKLTAAQASPLQGGCWWPNHIQCVPPSNPWSANKIKRGTIFYMNRRYKGSLRILQLSLKYYGEWEMSKGCEKPILLSSVELQVSVTGSSDFQDTVKGWLLAQSLRTRRHRTHT